MINTYWRPQEELPTLETTREKREELQDLTEKFLKEGGKINKIDIIVRKEVMPSLIKYRSIDMRDATLQQKIDRVLGLAKKGYNTDRIAKELNITKKQAGLYRREGLRGG